MSYWITLEGIYYESDTKIQPTDICVPRRPSLKHTFIDGEWLCYAEDSDYEGQSPQNINLKGMTRVRRRQFVPQPKDCSDCVYDSEAQTKQTKEGNKKDGGEVVLNNNTKVIFGVKELLMVLVFVGTAVISWQDTNTRISKLEDNKAVEALETRIKEAEMNIKNLDTKITTNAQKTDQNIRDVEQALFSMNMIKK